MIWRRIDTWAQQSACGRYLVCAVRVEGLFQFEAWSTGAGRKCLGRSADAAEARRLCEQDVPRETNNQQESAA